MCCHCKCCQLQTSIRRLTKSCSSLKPSHQSSYRFGFVLTAPVAAQTSLFPGAPGPWHQVLPAGDGLPGLKSHTLLLFPLSSPDKDLESQVSGSALQNRVVGQDLAFPGLDKSDHCENPARCNAQLTTAATVMGSQLLCPCLIQLSFLLCYYLSCWLELPPVLGRISLTPRRGHTPWGLASPANILAEGLSICTYTHMN